MAYIEIISTGADYVTCRINGLDRSYSRNDRTVFWYLDNGYPEEGTTHLYPYDEYSENFTYYDLAPGTEYELYVEIEYTDSGNVKYESFSEYVSTRSDTTGGDGEWTAVAVSSSTEMVPYNPPNDIYLYVNGRTYAGELRYQKFKVTQSGTYRIYADGYDYSICGYLSNSSDYDERSGTPIDLIREADGTDNGFELTYYLEFGEIYYLWFRMFNFDAEEKGWIFIEYQSEGGGESGGNGSEYNLGIVPKITIQEVEISKNGYARISYSPTQNGYMSLFTTGDYDTYGWFVEEDCKWDSSYREPEVYTKGADGGGPGPGHNCWIDGGNVYVRAGNTYYFWIKFYDEDVSGKFDAYIVPPQAGDLTLWDWNSSNGDATSTQTSKAHTACTGKGLLTDFSHIVWNDMVYKALECMVYKGFGWAKDYLSYEDTLMSSGDTYITAARYNSLTTQLYYIDSSYSVIVNPGDLILGSHFTDITEEMNYIIRNT